jgi:hypothetical protein
MGPLFSWMADKQSLFYHIITVHITHKANTVIRIRPSCEQAKAQQGAIRLESQPPTPQQQ